MSAIIDQLRQRAATSRDETLLLNTVEMLEEVLAALQTTSGNIRSLGPAGALDSVPLPYREWLAQVDAAIAKATGAA